jgi:hypothetical protein
MSDPTVTATEEQLKALEVFKDLIAHAHGRYAFVTAPEDDKEEVFDRWKEREEVPEDLRDAVYTEIPEEVRRLLERLSDSELALFSDIDATFVGAGLAVVRNPYPLMAH